MGKNIFESEFLASKPTPSEKPEQGSSVDVSEIRTASFDANPVVAEAIFAEMQRRGIASEAIKSSTDLITEMHKGRSEKDTKANNPLITGSAAREIVALSETVGRDEPSYLQLLGPEEILRLRQKEKPVFILAGAMGGLSAREFAILAKKINPDSQCHVFDLDTRELEESKYVWDLDKIENLTLTAGDALKMPFQPESADIIATNGLLVSLEKNGEPVRDMAEYLLFFQGAARTLRDNGSLLIVEQGNFARRKSMIRKTIRLAVEAGLTAEEYLPEAPHFLFRQDSSGTEIDAEGRLKFGEKTIAQDWRNMFAVRFVKRNLPPEEIARRSEMLERKVWLTEGKFEELNQILSYGRGEKFIHIHLGPSRTLPKREIFRLFQEGLEKLAKIIEQDESIEMVSAISPLIKEGRLEKFGFTFDGPVDRDFQQRHFPETEQTVNRAHISRADFLKHYLKN